MPPSQARTAFSANREFVDRDEARGRFQNAFADRQAGDEFRILNWYGVGGQGKSALAREFGRIVATDPSFAAKEMAAVHIDLDSKRLRHPEEALLSIRQQLAQAFGHRFAAFDTAYARYFALTNPGVRMREKHPELFRGENELLTDLLGWSGQGMGGVVEDIAKEIPGATLLYKYSARLSARLREWYERRGKHILADLDRLTADEIDERLPVYLGADICDLLKAQPKARIAVIIDTYEALWRDHNVKDQAESHRADQWVRLLARKSAGILLVILGRDKLVWDRVDPVWIGKVESHLLGALSAADADDFLRRVPIADAAIRAPMVASARGLPFYLDLQVDSYVDVLAQGRAPTAAQFGGDHPAILARFLEHLADEDRRVLRLASYPLALSEPMLSLLAKRFLGGIGHLNWGRLTRFSFMEPTAPGWASMHALMREKLQERERDERPEAFREIHSVLFDHFESLSRSDLTSQLTREHGLALESALFHAAASERDWLDAFHAGLTSFRQAARYGTAERLCRAALGLATASGRGEENDLTLLSLRHKLAQQIGDRGRYAEAEAEFRAISDIKRRPEVLGEEHPSTLATRHDLAQQIGHQGRNLEAEQEFRAIFEIERRPEMLGEENPSTLTTRRNLAQQIGAQDRPVEAEQEFRAIWDIERRPEVLGEEHPSTLTTRHNLAQQIGNQGRYAEAEQEFRAIWEIQRRPDVLGEEHPSTLTTWHNLALQIGKQDRFSEAEQEFRAIEAIQRRQEALGEEHPYHLRTRYWLARMIDGQDRHTEADPLFDGLDAKMAAYFSPEHRWRRELTTYLASRRNPN